MKTLAVIGTAGRGEDSRKLNIFHWKRMRDSVEKVFQLEGCEKIVSGGAAWADHIGATYAACNGIPLRIWMPEKKKDLEIAKYYHKKFGKVIKNDTWKFYERDNIEGRFEIHYYGGFKDRNTLVANEADVWLAMTFGHREKVKDGGTADTVNKMLLRGINGYHLDLNTLKLYKYNPWKEDLNINLKFKALGLYSKEP